METPNGICVKVVQSLDRNGNRVHTAVHKRDSSTTRETGAGGSGYAAAATMKATATSLLLLTTTDGVSKVC